MKQFTIRLDDELHKKLKYLSIEIDKSINEYITELIVKDFKERESCKESEKNKNNSPD